MCGCVRALIGRFRTFFVFAGLFSLAINALMLVPPIYMLQVFDRVLTSRSEETLVYLTIGGVTALVVMALLDMVRARLLGVAGAALDRTLGPRVLDGLLDRTERLIGTARGLPAGVAARGLRWESAVIVALAARLARRLRRDDPLEAPVKLAKSDFAAAFLTGILARR